jgi:aryl-alcohol dehydrogenase-like predicted oxidoreductase
VHLASRHGWTRFVSMQPHYNLLYREEEREMLGLCQLTTVTCVRMGRRKDSFVNE